MISKRRSESATRRFERILFAIVCAIGAVTLGLMMLPTRNRAESAPQASKPNILVIFGDDVGQANISAYTRGVVGYKTPNIDRLAREGMMFTDYYAENSCTAGRSTFITGQAPLRTGLSKVGLPGVAVGLQKVDITIAQAIKAQGQFGKNHLGDKNEYLPTMHGFDEFFGNLYHLNAEEEPEQQYWPKDPNDPIRKNFTPRGVLRTKAIDRDDPTVDPRFGKIGKRTIEDTGPLTRKRMETIDDETTAACIDFMNRQKQANKPFFGWMDFTRMHVFTHVRESMRGQSGMQGNEYADGMVEMDINVGKLLKALDDLGIADNTIVIFTTDNGPNQFSWPDAASTPFRNEKNSNWEGAFRVPAFVRWTGHIKAGEISNQIFSGLDWFPTLLAAAGDTTVKDRLLKGWQPPGSDAPFKNHLDGYNQLDYLTGKTEKSARNEFYYFNDDGDLVSMRYGDWKLVFGEQRAPGGFAVWSNPFTQLRVPKMFNLRQDPYERADVVSDQYYDLLIKNDYIITGGMLKATAFLETFAAYPPSQRPASFSIDQVRKGVDKVIDKSFKDRGIEK